MKRPDGRPPRIVTAAALFDGHDAAINIVRRLLVSDGALVVHLGHNRAVAELVKAAVEEDADAVCVSSYQGGHMEYFTYLVARLREVGAGHVKVFGGGGGVILPAEVEALERVGVEKIYTPEDGFRLGVEGMVRDLLLRIKPVPKPAPRSDWTDPVALSQAVTRALESEGNDMGSGAPVVGVTGTGGAGKSSLVDELAGRWLRDYPQRRLAVLAIDPARKRSGGALLGDRLRMTHDGGDRVFFRSMPSLDGGATVAAVRRAVRVLREAGVDLVIVETTGIGQGDTEILEMCDLPVYVMTTEYGAGTQLEKINMLDFAEVVVLNKFEDARAEDALMAVRRQVRRNHGIPATVPDIALPVSATVASRFNDPGVDRLYLDLLQRLKQYGLVLPPSRVRDPGALAFAGSRTAPLIPFERSSYLQRIVQAVHDHRARTDVLAARADQLEALERVCGDAGQELPGSLKARLETARAAFGEEGRSLLEAWDSLEERYGGETFAYDVRGLTHEVRLVETSLSGLPIRRVELPQARHWSDRIHFLRQENVPGAFPYTAGVFPFRRSDEEPKRQFAGEGGPERTNRRFHFLCRGERTRRLSTAFDSVTLYGEDPSERTDVFGKVGESGVSVATFDDMKTLFQGFDLCDPATSVSLTINGPAPVVLAMFLNAAIDQRLAAWCEASGRQPDAEEATGLREEALRAVRGTVQADILKEDQAQNTCIFSVPFSLRMMGDVQDFLIRHRMRNYYSVSISGYHIAEAGANPVTQLAFTLANAFTLVEYYLGRGMAIDDISPNLSFFFSSGLDPEYAVMGRVARRIWAIAMRDLYGASESSQKLKHHMQTSGRSLHLREMKFNDIRTTLQALTALLDNCSSLHTNAYDEAFTTPTEESVRIAMAIQLIITREFGLYRSENLAQGSHFLERLTDLVEEAVLEEFLHLNARGGVLKAMETQYQRQRIQDQSFAYEAKKHSGELPVVGVNTFTRDEAPELASQPVSRASEAEKRERLDSLAAFHARHAEALGPALERVREAIRSGGNIFDALMEAVRVASLGQITSVLYEMGGRYRRAM